MDEVEVQGLDYKKWAAKRDKVNPKSASKSALKPPPLSRVGKTSKVPAHDVVYDATDGTVLTDEHAGYLAFVLREIYTNEIEVRLHQTLLVLESLPMYQPFL